jgi:hypothetical protein
MQRLAALSARPPVDDGHLRHQIAVGRRELAGGDVGEVRRRPALRPQLAHQAAEQLLDHRRRRLRPRGEHLHQLLVASRVAAVGGRRGPCELVQSWASRRRPRGADAGRAGAGVVTGALVAAGAGVATGGVAVRTVCPALPVRTARAAGPAPGPLLLLALLRRAALLVVFAHGAQSARPPAPHRGTGVRAQALISHHLSPQSPAGQQPASSTGSRRSGASSTGCHA